MSSKTWARMRRGLNCPPHVVAWRLATELNHTADRLFAWRRTAHGVDALLRSTGDATLDRLWSRLARRPYVAHVEADGDSLRRYCPGEQQRLQTLADLALERRVDLLGSGEIELGRPIDWHRDYKTGLSWPPRLACDLDYSDPDRPSDVKFPWELSRLQWLIPAGQTYLLTRQERYAAAVRDVLEEWIAGNPYLFGVNWACPMEVALRIVCWTWLFHVFHASAAWAEMGFRARFLSCLYDHARFTDRYLEYSDVNANHCTADAAGLVFAGLFFGAGRSARRWLRHGWRLLQVELFRQVSADGVDFEASVAYHRLVLELFLLPALYGTRHALTIPKAYQRRITQMARFVQAYGRPDGSVPWWGDSDDGRLLPLGGLSLNDHRYLLGLVGTAWDVDDLKAAFSGPRAEVYWLLGPQACAALPDRRQSRQLPGSQAFAAGGFYVLCNDRDHVFLDCGPVGLAGRGGHGHNDCLALEAVLDGQRLVVDCGSYVYTASYSERNAFRSTAYHNTPQIKNQEINRFPADGSPWRLHNDARHRVLKWRPGPQRDVFCGTHSGYSRLRSAMTPIRTVVLDHHHHGLVIHDRFEPLRKASVDMEIEVPLHLAPGVQVDTQGSQLLLRTDTGRFQLVWQAEGPWMLDLETGRASPSYGRLLPIVRLAWRYRGPARTSLQVALAPADAFAHGNRWIEEALRGQH